MSSAAGLRGRFLTREPSWLQSDLGLAGAAMAVVILLAIVVRLIGMGHPLLPDEGYTWLVASAPNAGNFLHRLAVYENTPPLYYLLLTPLPLDSEWWVRLPSLISGVVMVAMVYWIVRPALGRATAVLASLAVAVAPYAVAESNWGRGFMLADLGLLAAFWAAVRLAEGRTGRWWWLYGAGTVLAIYSEYDAAITLAPLVLGLILLSPGRRWRTLGLAILPGLAFLPWIHQLSRSLHYLDVTKTGIGYLTLTPGYARDQLVTAFYGETGQRLGAAPRTLAFLVLVCALAWGCLAMYRRGRDARPLFVLLVLAGLGTFVLHALAAAAGVGIFNVSYLTVLIPLGCIALAAAVAAIPIRAVVPIACLGLVGLGAGLVVRRLHKAPDIDPQAIRSVLAAEHVRTILTNSAVVAYYFRTDHAILDRPFNLGSGLAGDCRRCGTPLAVVDDARVGAGARPGPGRTVPEGHYVVRLIQR